MGQSEHVAGTEQFHHLTAAVCQELVEHDHAADDLEHAVGAIALEKDQAVRREPQPLSFRFVPDGVKVRHRAAWRGNTVQRCART
jgi:hypothetical protein